MFKENFLKKNSLKLKNSLNIRTMCHLKKTLFLYNDYHIT